MGIVVVLIYNYKSYFLHNVFILHAFFLVDNSQHISSILFSFCFDLFLNNLSNIVSNALRKFIFNNTLIFNPNQNKRIGYYYSNIKDFDETWDEYKKSKQKLTKIPNVYNKIV